MPATPATDSEWSDFLLRACHDLRAPLRAMRIHTELLSRQRAGESVGDPEQSLTFLVNGATAASAVVDGIADYALALAIDATRFHPVPLDVMLRGALAKLSRQLKEGAAKVTYDDLPSVMGDADRLLQLFEYLVDHTLRHRGPALPDIHIAAEREKDAWLFTLHDHCGSGVTADSLERAFRPFARMHANQRAGPGLAICRAIVERHRGRIWGEPDTGGGCVFRFTLPADDPMADAPTG